MCSVDKRNTAIEYKEYSCSVDKRNTAMEYKEILCVL